MNKRAYGLMCLLGWVVSGPLGCTVDRNSQVAPAGVAQWSLQPNTLVADGNSAGSYQLTAYRATGEVYKGAQVAVDASDAHVLVEEPPLSDPLGTTSATVRCTQPGTFTLTARVYQGELWYPLAGTASLTCVQQRTAAPQQAPNLTLTALYDIAATGVGTPLPLTLQVTDAQGQPLAGQWVTLTTARAGDQVVPTTAHTDAQGRVQVALTATSLGAATVVAQAGAATANVTVQFVAGAPNPATSTFAARPGPVPADGHESQLLDLTVRDGAGRPVPYVPVTLTSDQPSDGLSPTAALTDASGHLSVALTGTRAGSRTVTASLYNGPLTAQAALEPGPSDAAHSQLVLTPTMIAADGVSSSAIAVLLADAHGNAISSANVALSSSVVTDVIDPAVGMTLADGTMAASIAGTLAGARMVAAQSGNVTLTATLTLVADAPSSGLSTLTVAPPAPTAGLPCTVTLLLLDGQHNPVAGQAVTFASSVPGDGLTAALPAVTGADGRLTGSFLATQACARTLTATVAGLSVTAPLTVLAGAPSAGTSALASSPSVQVADDVSVITLTASFKDVFNNPILGSAVTWSGGGAQDTFSAPTSSTDSLGAAVSTLRSTLAHALPVYAQLGNLTLGANVTFAAGPPSQAQSSLQANPNSAVADGAATSTLTAIINDAFGNPVPGLTVTFTAGGSNNTLGAASAPTNSSGLASTTLSSTRAETKALTAQTGGMALNGNVTFAPGSPNLAMSTLTIAPLVRVADGNQAITAFAQIYDAYANPVPGLAASVTVSGASTTVTPSTGTTDAAGSFVSSVSTPVVQTQNITLTAGPFTATASANFTLGPPNAATSSFVAIPNTSLASDGSATSTMTVTLRDSLSRVLPNQAVRFSAAGSRGALTSLSSITDGLGMAQTALTSIYAGNTVVLANVGSMALNANAQFSSKPPFCSTSLALGQRPVSLRLSAGASRIDAADLNQDGNMDLIFSLGTSAGINIFFGQGYGKFSSAQTYSRPQITNNVAIADFNHDNYLDIAHSVQSNYVSILFGQSSPSMIAQGTVSTGASGTGAGVCAGDINQDGHVDLVSVYNSPASLAILLGDGGGGFTLSATYPVHNSVSRCAVEDFDGDGHADIAVANWGDSSVDIRYGSADGTFSAAKSFGVGSKVFNLEVGRINQDALVDIAVVNNVTNGTAGILLGAPGRSFQPVVSYPVGTSPSDPKLIDLNGDGNNDIVVNNAGGGITYLLGLGDGTFTSARYASAPGNTSKITAADFDNDGALDIAYSLSNVNIGGVTYGTAPGVLPDIPGAIGGSLASGINRNLAIADFNMDGHMDILGVGQGVAAAFFAGAGTGQFLPPSQIAGTSTNGSAYVAAGDINGDGAPDAVIINYTSPTLSILINDGNGHFTITTINNPTSDPEYASATIGDVNGDGLGDIIVSLGTNYVYQYITASPSANTFSSSIINTGATICERGRVVDVNNDGLADLVMGCNDLVVMLGNGTGSYSAPTRTSTGTIRNAYRVDTADFNGDGYVDAFGSDSSLVAIFINQRDGTFAKGQTLTTTADNWYGSAEDINGDGFVDLVFATIQQLNVFIGTGTGSFGTAQVYPGPQFYGIAVSDLNHDGKADIVAASRTDGLIEYLSTGCTPN